MKLGINTFLFCSPFSTEQLHWLNTFHQWGFDCAELALENPALVDAKEVQQALSSSGLSHLISCGVYGPGRDLRGSPTEQQAAIDYTKTILDMMPVYDSRVFCGPLYSSVGRTDAYSESEKQQQFDTVAKNLRLLCDHAQQRGIVIAMEVLNRFETDFINTCEQAVTMIEAVGSPALKVHLDTFHMNIEENSFAEAIEQAGEHLGHFHASGSHRGAPGNDTIDWEEVRDALYAIDYQGDVVIESFSKGVKTIARACSIWRDLGTPESIARNGLQHLNTLFADGTRAAVNVE
jgi:D-psicose/D-tagatose/L-ribulose 3-epimerase